MQYFAETILLILFAFTLETALATAGGVLTRHPSAPELWSLISGSPLRYAFGALQIIAFVFTLSRFFFGAYRFHTESKVSSQDVELHDAIGTVVLFIAFYAAALLVTGRGLFLIAMVVVHIVDLLWFLFTTSQDGAVAHIKKAASHFLTYDVVTIVLLVIPLVWYQVAPFNRDLFPLFASLVLLGISAVDLCGPTRAWYFDPEKWKRAHGG